MPRPRSNSNMIVASADGVFLFWLDGAFSGDDQALLANVRLAARTHLTMLLTAEGPALVADDAYAVGAVAALLAAKPGRVQILSAPPSVMELYPAATAEDNEVLVIDGIVQGREVGLYTTGEVREMFDLFEDDARVKVTHV